MKPYVIYLTIEETDEHGDEIFTHTEIPLSRHNTLEEAHEKAYLHEVGPYVMLSIASTSSLDKIHADVAELLQAYQKENE